MIKIAIPNKGSLSDEAVELLKDSGYLVRKDSRQLVLFDQNNDVQFFYLRPRDIAVYVGSGVVDLGITGLDLLKDSDSDAQIVEDLGFGASKFYFAAPNALLNSFGNNINVTDFIKNKTVATSYQKIVKDFCDKHNVNIKIVKLDGAVESSIDLGVADIIADVVSTGTTLKQAGLQTFGDPILISQAVLIKSANVAQNDVNSFVSRLKGIITARKYVLVTFDIDDQNVDKAIAVAPGFESPTISNLSSGAKSVSIMIERVNLNTIMDQLKSVGARAILATEIIATRL